LVFTNHKHSFPSQLSIIQGSTCNDKKAAKGLKSSCQATTNILFGKRVESLLSTASMKFEL